MDAAGILPGMACARAPITASTTRRKATERQLTAAGRCGLSKDFSGMVR